MANKHMKIFLASLIPRDMQIKIAIRDYLTSIRRATVQKHKLSVGENVETEILVHCWQECSMP